MAPILLAGIAAALWIAVLNKMLQLWRAPEDLPLRALGACVVSATLTFTVNLPPFGPLLDNAGDGVRKVMINLGTMAAAYFLLAFFTYSVRGPAARHAVRWQAVPLTVGILVAVGAWALAPAAVRVDPASATNGTDPHATVFVVAVLGYMAYAHSQSLRWSIAYVRVAATARLRRSLLLISLAVGAFLVADAIKSLLAVLQSATEPPTVLASVFNIVYLAGVGIGALAFVVGVSHAAVSGMLAAWPLRRAHRRRYRELEPLWSLMNEEFPHLTLGRVPATSWSGRLGWGGVHYRFYRRVIEIRDGLVQLAPYYETSPTGRTPAESGPTRWALLIHGALRAKHTGSPVVEAEPVLVPGGDDLESDARLLADIAREVARVRSGPPRDRSDRARAT
jgi:hypothetical protein